MAIGTETTVQTGDGKEAAAARVPHAPGRLDGPTPGAGAFRPVVIAPTYNNERTLLDILHRVEALGLPIIVVNDGSTDSTGVILRAWAVGGTAGRRAPVQVLSHRRNRGKGAALRTGFKAAMEAGYTHAVTLDTDGQHDPESIPEFLGASQKEPDALILGRRRTDLEGCPKRSLTGRRWSNMAIWIESGAHVQDSQCGMRVYPLGLIRAVKTRAGRFAFEAEIITRAAWAGCSIVEVPVVSRYLPAPERVSHYRPWLDSIHGVLVHARLIGRALIPWPGHSQWPARPARDAVSAMDTLRGLRHWMSPLKMWRQLRENPQAHKHLAAGLAVGVWVANSPLYGLHTVMCLYFAKRLHLHPLAVITGSMLSTPPVGLVLNAAAVYVGHYLLHGSWPEVLDFEAYFSEHGLTAGGGMVILEWGIGSLIVGTVMAVATFVVTAVLIRLFSKREGE